MSPGAGKCLSEPWRIPVIPSCVSKGAQLPPEVWEGTRGGGGCQSTHDSSSFLPSALVGAGGHTVTHGDNTVTHGDTRCPLYSHLDGFMQTCSSGCGSKQTLTKEERREIPNVGVSRSLSPATLGPSDYSNCLSQSFLWIRKR